MTIIRIRFLMIESLLSRQPLRIPQVFLLSKVSFIAVNTDVKISKKNLGQEQFNMYFCLLLFFFKINDIT